MPDSGKRISREFFIERMKKSLGVDTRFTVLDFIPSKGDLHILTNSLPTAMHITDVYQKASPRFRIKAVLLPDKSVGNLTKGVCHVGVAPVRKSAASASEQTTQVLYGETFDTLQVQNGWVRVRLHADGYIGWISSDQATLMDDGPFYDYQFIPKVYVSEKSALLMERPLRESNAVRECVFGNALRVTGRNGSFLSIRTPDGISGWVEKAATAVSIREEKFSAGKLLRTAKRFLGISYAWGGRSTKGFDCSGFVQTVFRLNGISLPRDADLQFLAGNRVTGGIGRLRTGDLLFFSSNGHKISHVAIYTGRNSEFIHSSGFVRINSLDRKRKNFSRKLSSTFVGACRVI